MYYFHPPFQLEIFGAAPVIIYDNKIYPGDSRSNSFKFTVNSDRKNGSLHINGQQKTRF